MVEMRRDGGVEAEGSNLASNSPGVLTSSSEMLSPPNCFGIRVDRNRFDI
ncbi:MAG: hypothetical protein KGQ48_14670 [Bradyrhizobium sp.]|nr:hypothetical protein [Bradyrhizobium sp.]